MSDIQAILFDAGGTLIHVDGERFCAAAAIPFEAERFARAEAAATGRVRAWILRHPDSTDARRLPLFLDEILRGLGMDEPVARERAARLVAREHGHCNLWSRAVAGAGETLGALVARGYRLGVVSNADGRVRRLLEDAALAPFLEVILDSAEVGVEKPDPRIFLAAVDRLGLPAACCAYVGDLYEIDVLGARAAGLRPILIGPDAAPEPVERAAELADLLEIFPARLSSLPS